jgi:hypothetical protein
MTQAAPAPRKPLCVALPPSGLGAVAPAARAHAAAQPPRMAQRAPRRASPTPCLPLMDEAFYPLSNAQDTPSRKNNASFRRRSRSRGGARPSAGSPAPRAAA